jgi:DUF971 family protein
MSHEGIRISSREEQEREVRENRPLERSAVTPKKVRVLLSEGKGLEIGWEDGHRSAWDFKWLRDACPCATCVEERTLEGRKAGEAKKKPAQLLPMYAPPARPRSAQAVGRYAIQFQWEDGHSGGIYSWEYLRRMCRCGECQRAATEIPEMPG